MNKIRVGVVGVGHLGSLHAKLYNEIENAVLCGVYDTDPEKSGRIAAEQNTKSYQDLDALLREADAVSIVTPTSTHHEAYTRPRFCFKSALPWIGDFGHILRASKTVLPRRATWRDMG